MAECTWASRAATLGMGNEAFSRLQLMATDRSMYASMITAHNDGPQILCDDGNGSIPELVNRLLIQSKPGRLMLLPALPQAMPRGSLCGTCARGQIAISQLRWDMPAGTITAAITSKTAQRIGLVLPPGMVVDGLKVNGLAQAVVSQGVGKQGFNLDLPKAQLVVIEVRFHPQM